MLSEDFGYYFEKSGGPIESRAMSLIEISEIQLVLPKDLVDLMIEIGRFTFGKGIVQVCHPSDFASVLKLIFKEDAEIIPEKCHAFLYSAFGKLYFWLENKGIGYINFLDSSVVCKGITDRTRSGAQIEKTIHVPFSDEMEAYDVLDMNGKPLFTRACKKLGVPIIGQCFGFLPILTMGGERKLGNLRLYEAKVHFTILAQTNSFRLIRSSSPTTIETVRFIGLQE